MNENLQMSHKMLASIPIKDGRNARTDMARAWQE